MIAHCCEEQITCKLQTPEETNHSQKTPTIGKSGLLISRDKISVALPGRAVMKIRTKKETRSRRDPGRPPSTTEGQRSDLWLDFHLLSHRSAAPQQIQMHDKSPHAMIEII